MKQVINFLPNLFKLVGGLMGDRRVPFFEKLLVVGLLGYVLFPLDLVPDLIPLAGQLDDLLLAAIVIQRLLNRGTRNLEPVLEREPGGFRMAA